MPRPPLLCAALAILIPLLAPPARADETAECTTTVTVRCRGAVAPLALPPVEVPPAVAAPTMAAPQLTYPRYPYAPAWVPPPPATMHTEERRNWGLFSAGLSIFLGSYLLNAAVAYLTDDGRLAVPIIGPLLLIDQRRPHVATPATDCFDCQPVELHDSPSSSERGFAVLMVFDALVQTTGAVLAITGLATTRKVKVFDRLTVLPAGGNGPGLTLSGSF